MVVTLVALDVLLMAFSVAMWQLSNAAMAATAGAGAIALTADIARRLLHTSGSAIAETPAVPPVLEQNQPERTAGTKDEGRRN